MEENEKMLLFKDLCARLVYHPWIQVTNKKDENLDTRIYETLLHAHHLTSFSSGSIDIIPFLRPLNTMTQEETKELNELVPDFDLWADDEGCHITDNDFDLSYEQMSVLLDWLNKHQFNYRLPKRLFIYKPKYFQKEEEK